MSNLQRKAWQYLGLFNGRVRALLLVWLIVICPAIALGQPVILRGDKLPATALENTWFHNQSDQHIYQYKQGKWQDAFLGRKAKIIKPCNALVLILQEGTDVFSLYMADGERLCEGSGSYAAHTGIFYADLGYPMIVDARPQATRKKPSELLISSESHCAGIRTDTIQGKLYYCVPRWVPGINRTIQCQDIHGWGMLGTDAEWLIEPIYDGPFNFEGDNAIVSYYGQRFKINEKGKRVE